MPTVHGQLAFVPGPPPPELSLSAATVRLLDEASNALGVLAGVGRQLPNPHLLISPYVVREAVLSSRIEGTRSTMADVYAANAGQMEMLRSSDVLEVQNYIRAHEHGLERLQSLPLSLRLIRELHARLMEGVRGHDQRPGGFRSSQSYIGPPGASIAEATYVPPPVPEMERALGDLERFLHERELPPLVQAAVAHYQFEAIHPFADGNGRVGRLLISLFLCERGLLPQPLLYLSAYFERTRGQYYEGLLRVSTHGEWEAWIRYFLEGVRTQAREGVEDAERLVGLQARYRREVAMSKARPAAYGLLDRLFANPFVTAKGTVEALGVSDPTARAAIADLVKLGILAEVSGRKWGRVFLASEVLEALRGHAEQDPQRNQLPTG